MAGQQMPTTTDIAPVGSASNPIQTGTTAGGPQTPPVATTPVSASTTPPSASPVTLDFSTATPLGQQSTTTTAAATAPVTLDFSTATPIDSPKSDEFGAGQPIGKQIAELPATALEGIGEGIFGTAANAADIADKITGQRAGKIDAYLHQLAGDNDQTHGFGQEIGRGTETLTEFLLGDAALKGLSFADKMTQVAKTAKILESSPKLLAALRLGVNVSKAVGDLSPEAAQAVRESPILARLVGAGYDAVRSGIVQGGQTALHTEGNGSQSLKDALEMGGVSAVTGGVLGTIGGAAAKAGKSAEAFKNLSDAAANAPSNEALAGNIEGQVNAALKPQVEAATNAKTAGTSDFEGFTQNAPSKESLTEAARTDAQNTEQGFHNAYTTGINKIKGKLAGQTIDYEGSPLQQAVSDLSGQGETGTTPLTRTLGKTRPGTPDVNGMIENLLKLNKEEPEEVGETPQLFGPSGQPLPASGVTPEEVTKPYPMSLDELIDARKKVSERLRNTGWATDAERANRNTYRTLIDGIDNTMGELVAKSGNPEVLQQYQEINNAYRQSRRLIENPDVQMLLQGKNTELMAKLMSGGTALNDINAVKSVIGPQNFNRFSTDLLQRWAADATSPEGAVDYDKLLRQWNQIGKRPDVRTALFGQLGSDTMTNVLNGITGADAKLTGINDTIADLLANKDTKGLLNNPAKIDQLASVVGPDAMNQISQAALHNELREASTIINPKTGKLAFDPNKFLDWAARSLKDNPEGMAKLFRRTPETDAAFNQMLRDADTATAVRRLAKTGVGLTAGAVGAALAHSGLFGAVNPGALSETLGGLLGLTFASDKLAGARLFDSIANNPKVLAALTKAGKLADKGVISPAAATAKTATAKGVYSGLKSILGGNQ